MTTCLNELAALTAAFSWAGASIFFTLSSQRLGAATVNRTRLLLAAVLLGAIHLGLYGVAWPAALGIERFGWLALSGLMAHVLGDGILYEAYVWLGPRLAMLLGALTPIFATAMAWYLWGEALTVPEGIAMGIVLGGVAWVVMERAGRPENGAGRERNWKLGVAFGVMNPFFQAIALIAAKQGLRGDFSPLSAVVVRISLAALVAWAWAILRGRVGATAASLRRDRSGNLALIGGTITGPLIGASLSLVALRSAHVGVISVLLAMSPVMLLPLARIFLREQITWRAVAGTAIAMSGVVLLLLN